MAGRPHTAEPIAAKLCEAEVRSPDDILFCVHSRANTDILHEQITHVRRVRESPWVNSPRTGLEDHADGTGRHHPVREQPAE